MFQECENWENDLQKMIKRSCEIEALTIELSKISSESIDTLQQKIQSVHHQYIEFILPLSLTHKHTHTHTIDF